MTEGVAPAPESLRPAYLLRVHVQMPPAYKGDPRPLVQCVLRMVAHGAAKAASDHVHWCRSPTNADGVRIYTDAPAQRMAGAVADAAADAEKKVQALYRRAGFRVHFSLARYMTTHVTTPRPGVAAKRVA